MALALVASVFLPLIYIDDFYSSSNTMQPLSLTSLVWQIKIFKVLLITGLVSLGLLLLIEYSRKGPESAIQMDNYQNRKSLMVPRRNHPKIPRWDNKKHKKENGTKVKIVLTWNTFYGSNFAPIGTGAVKEYCPRSKCIFTNKKSILKKADAVMFHMWPTDTFGSPKWRASKQHYVFLLNESPVRREYNFERYDHFFNVTMTYRLDSDIPFLYGAKNKRNVVLPPSHPWWVKLMDIAKKKTQPIAWIVSHCTTDSKREHYVEELKKYIQIDVYGRCGTMQCLPPRSVQCSNKIARTYSFVLAFENSICRDYVTEKVFEIVNFGVVPIVYGGADYEQILPFHSYIDVHDFESPKRLAGYLHHLLQNKEEYLKYYEWHRSYRLTSGYHEWHRSFCKLCDFLHSPKHRHKSYSSQDLKNHWGPQNCDSNYLKAMQDRW